MREVPEEAAIAVTYNGATHAVMMATPTELEDFAVGFSLTERIISDVGQIRSVEIAAFPLGVEARLWVDEECAGRLSARRRAMAGPTGCGLCGVESLDEALPEPAVVGADDVRFRPEQIMEAIDALSAGQPLFRETHAVHAAGFWTPDDGLVAAREDLGRHNAMDKLVGALKRNGVDQTKGIATITSRVSVEIVQKAAVLGVPVLVAVSAPTMLAIRTAEAAGLTLVGVARRDGFEAFTRTERITF
ncbi:formate dehydrogenase accessory sulfurtransferase FdhD [Breoghania corrubedonensis]|nr:formate dehydrogenase accessory sulfurtransferase FdhD [Breoghania corrubedonensis]